MGLRPQGIEYSERPLVAMDLVVVECRVSSGRSVERRFARKKSCARKGLFVRDPALRSFGKQNNRKKNRAPELTLRLILSRNSKGPLT